MFRNIKSIVLGLIVVSLMIGCGGPPRPGANKANEVQKRSVSSDAKAIYISSKATYHGTIAPNIKSECSIDSQVMKFIKSYGESNGLKVIVNGKPKSTDRVLKITIVDAISAGNAGMGHNKYVTISGKLYDGKKLKASFKASRRSGGGYFGAYRSSCSVLGSCAKSLGRDTAAWLTNPVNGAKLGDAYLIK